MSDSREFRWMPAGAVASVYGAFFGLLLFGLLIGSRAPERLSMSTDGGSNGRIFGNSKHVGTPSNKDLTDAVENIRLGQSSSELSSFINSLNDNIKDLPSSTRDDILNGTLKDILDDIDDPKGATQEAIAAAIESFSNPDFQALGYSKLARKCSSQDASEKYANLAWSKIQNSRPADLWFVSVFNFIWPVAALVCGFFATNMVAEFLKTVGKHLATMWIASPTSNPEDGPSSDKS